MTSNGRTYYEQAGLWSGETADSADVIEAIMEMWPDDATTALDVGCGNGAITNFLTQHRSVIGGDFSLTALQRVTAPAVAMSADALPFADGSFDLTMATDVFEHLPAEILDQSIAEIVRVSRRYILFCVPQHEPAQYFQVHCANCGTLYHAHHHQRRYDISDFASISGTSIVASRSVGARWAIPSDSTATTMRDWTESSYDFPLAVCLQCETIQGPAEHDPSTDQLERRFEALQYLRCEAGIEPTPCRSELAVLLEKTGSAPDNADAVSRHDLSRQRLDLPVDDVEEIDFSPNRLRQTLATYPDQWTWLADGETAVLIVARSPRRIEVIDGAVDSIQLYDAIDGRYIASAASPDGSFDLPRTRPDARGYRIQLGAIKVTTTRLRVFYRTPDQISPDRSLPAVAFGTELFEQYVLAESRRVADITQILERESARADSNARRVQELYDEVQVLAADREKLNVMLNEAHAKLAQQRRPRLPGRNK